MANLYRTILLAIVLAHSALAGTIDPIHFSASINPTSPGVTQQITLFDSSFVLLISGGTGMDEATFGFRFLGSTCEPDGGYQDCRGTEMVTVDNLSGTGFSIFYSFPVSPFSCFPPYCDVSFTYGVPEVLHVTGVALANYNTSGATPPGYSYPGEIIADTFLNGIRVVSNPDANVSFTRVADAPDPSTMILMLAGLTFLSIESIRRTIRPGPSPSRRT